MPCRIVTQLPCQQGTPVGLLNSLLQVLNRCYEIDTIGNCLLWQLVRLLAIFQLFPVGTGWTWCTSGVEI